MKKYYLYKNVYVVRGAERSAIYNFNSRKLFSINQKTSDLISKIIRYGNIKITEEIKAVIKSLSDNKIVTTNPKISNKEPDIKNLGKRSTINWAWIEVTKKCNLKCLHCYENSSPKEEDIMSIDDFKYVIRQLLNMGIKKIQLIGGEPFVLGNTLIEMLECCKDKFQFIEVFTNGTLLTDNYIKVLKKWKINIAISVYSYDKNEHDKMTQTAGSFENTNRAIGLLKKENIPVRIETVAINSIDIGKKSQSCFEIKKIDCVRIRGRASLKMYNKKMLKQKIITKNSFKLPLNVSRIRSNLSGHNCFSSKIYIDTDLNIFPCVMERDLIHGNLYDKNISEVLKEEILALTKDNIDECRNCEYRYACFDCRPDRISKNTFAKPWYCSYNPQKGAWTDVETFIEGLLK